MTALESPETPTVSTQVSPGIYWIFMPLSPVTFSPDSSMFLFCPSSFCPNGFCCKNQSTYMSFLLSQSFHGLIWTHLFLPKSSVFDSNQLTNRPSHLSNLSFHTHTTHSSPYQWTWWCYLTLPLLGKLNLSDTFHHTAPCCPIALIHWIEAKQSKLLIQMILSSNKTIEKRAILPCFWMLYHKATIPGQASLLMGPFPSSAPKISKWKVLMMLEFWKWLCRQHFGRDFILLVSIAES